MHRFLVSIFRYKKIYLYISFSCIRELHNQIYGFLNNSLSNILFNPIFAPNEDIIKKALGSLYEEYQ